jgi:CheY-like chemotaxis protein
VRKILIVDDDTNNRAVMHDALDCEDFELLEACDGREALNIVQQEKPDLILLDVLMPGIDGLETLRLPKHISIA